MEWVLQFHGVSAIPWSECNSMEWVLQFHGVSFRSWRRSPRFKKNNNSIKTNVFSKNVILICNQFLNKNIKPEKSLMRIWITGYNLKLSKVKRPGRKIYLDLNPGIAKAEYSAINQGLIREAAKKVVSLEARSLRPLPDPPPRLSSHRNLFP